MKEGFLMKKLLAVLLCALVLMSSLSVLCFAEYPVEGRDEPSVETAVENTIGKVIPSGKDVADTYFNGLNTIRDYLQRLSDFFKDMLTRVKESVSSIEWVPGWMR